MSQASLRRRGADLAQRRKPPAARRGAVEREAQALATTAAAFGLCGLDIELDATALWSDAADAYRLETQPSAAAANDAQVNAERAFPTIAARGPALAPSAPARFMQAIDWLVAVTAAEAAALWGAGASLLALPLLDAASFLLAAGALNAGLWLTDVYRIPPARARPDGAVGGLALGAVAGLVLAALFAPDARAAAALAAIVPAAALLMVGAHAALALWIAAAHRAGLCSEKIVLIGATDAAQRLAERAAQTGEVRILAVADDRISRSPARIADAPVAGSVDQLMAWEGLPYVDRIVIAVPQMAERRVRVLIERLRALPNRIDLLLDHDVMSVRGAGADRLGGMALACVSEPRRLAHAPLKRALDIAGAILLLAVLALPMLMIATGIRIESRGPALRRQARLGLNNRVFTLYTFRTRLLDLPRTRRGLDALTRLGRLLERTRLDELPQVLNVLRGEMSIVGPRPHAPDVRVSGRALRQIAPDYAHRHRVKPGLISWARLNGAHGPFKTVAAVRRHVELDLEYVARASVWFDLEILAKAAWTALAHGRGDDAEARAPCSPSNRGKSSFRRSSKNEGGSAIRNQ